LVKNMTFEERKTSNLLEHSYVRNRNPSSVADSMGNVIYYFYDMRNCLKKESTQGAETITMQRINSEVLRASCIRQCKVERGAMEMSQNDSVQQKREQRVRVRIDDF
jgi:hypothetical protein